MTTAVSGISFPAFALGMILMEIKIPGVCPLWLSQLLSEAQAYPTSFSKYGACYKNHLLPGRQERIKEEFCCA